MTFHTPVLVTIRNSRLSLMQSFDRCFMGWGLTVLSAQEPRGSRVGPVGPTVVQRPDTVGRAPQALGKPNLGGRRLLEPLLQIVRVVGKDIAPFIGCTLFSDPLVLARPPQWSNEDEGGARLFRIAEFGASANVANRLGRKVIRYAEFPTGVALWHPG